MDATNKAKYILSFYIRDIEQKIKLSSTYYRMPVALVSIFMLFIGDHFVVHKKEYCWNVEEPLLSNMIKSSNGDEFKSPSFDIGKTRWNIDVSPNGYEPDEIGQFMVYVNLILLPETWKHIVVSLSICYDKLDLKYNNIQSYTKDLSVGWNKNTLLLDEIKNETQLSFKVKIKILKIVLKNKNKIFYECCDVYNIIKKQEIKWIFNKSLINKLQQTTQPATFCSEIFNDMWCIGCSPDGWNKENKGKFILYLKLCGLPFNVKNLFVNYTIKVNELNVGMYDNFTFGYGLNVWNWKKAYDMLTLQDVQKYSGETLTVTIDIVTLAVFNQDNKDITDIYLTIF